MSETCEVKAKVCTGCDEVKLLSEFYSNSTSKGGKVGQCKQCITDYNKKKKMDDPAKHKAIKLSDAARSRAAAANKPCDFTFVNQYVFRAILIRLIGTNCPVCGEPFASIRYEQGGNRATDRHAITVDCFDPELGYTRENTRFICHQCNSRKNAHTLESALALVNWFLQGAPDINNEALPCNTIKLPPILPASVSTS